MRLIDADELKKHIPRTKVDILENCRNCKLLDDWQVNDIIDNIPTIDMVKHAHWIFDNCLNGYAQCSNCKLFAGRWDADSADNYCSHCGRKMDEVSE